MRLLALLSGGKDSVAAIEVARGHGWEVVAALKMVPAEDDAYMFHTPNLAQVDKIAQSLGLPLVEAVARADPLLEIEDLEAAVAAAKDTYRLDGVLSGALASEYQKTRIDRIGHRLGLKTFAPLWHKQPATYMEGLLQAGYDIRFSRVAAEGLDESWAGARLDAGRLEALRAKRLHVAGEGGEYETLVVDGPGFSAPVAVGAGRVEATASRATWHADTP